MDGGWLEVRIFLKPLLCGRQLHPTNIEIFFSQSKIIFILVGVKDLPCSVFTWKQFTGKQWMFEN